jgi:ribonuclease HI
MEPPCRSFRFKRKVRRKRITIEVYTDGSKGPSGVGAGIAVFKDKHPMFQLRYKLVERCSSNQAEQLAIAKALEKIQDLNHLQENQRTAAIHTDSKTTPDAIANLRNH